MAKSSPEPVPVKPEHDIMPDGYARGFSGDTIQMRKEFRTPAAICYHAKPGEDHKALIQQYNNREAAKTRKAMEDLKKK